MVINLKNMEILTIDSFWGSTESAQTWFAFITLALSFLSVVGLLVTINIQTFALREQSNVNKRQIELLELQIMEYSRRFIPKFSLKWIPVDYKVPMPKGKIELEILDEEPMYIYSVGLVGKEHIALSELYFAKENYHKILTAGKYDLLSLEHSDKFFWCEIYDKNELNKPTIEIAFEIIFSNSSQTRKFRTVFVYINQGVRIIKTEPVVHPS